MDTQTRAQPSRFYSIGKPLFFLAGFIAGVIALFCTLIWLGKAEEVQNMSTISITKTTPSDRKNTSDLAVPPLNSKDVECVTLFTKDPTANTCLPQLPWIEYSTSTKGSLSASISYITSDTYTGLRRFMISDAGTVLKVSYVPAAADISNMIEETPSIYDFGKDYMYYIQAGSAWSASRVYYNSFSGTPTSYVQFLRNDTGGTSASLLFLKTSTTTAEFYSAGVTGFTKIKKYSLPEDMKEAGYELGATCTGDPCGDSKLIIKSFEGSKVVFNTHRYADIPFTCPDSPMYFAGLSFANYDHPLCASSFALAEGEKIDDSFPREIKSVKADGNGKTQTVVIGNGLIQGRTVTVNTQ